MWQKPTWIVRPGFGLDGVAFGERKSELREHLGEHDTFRRTTDDRETDHFVRLGLLLHYDGADSLDFIELADPAAVKLDGVSLLNRSMDDVIEEVLSDRSVRVERDDEGCEFVDLGVGLYVPDMETKLVAGVSVRPVELGSRA